MSLIRKSVHVFIMMAFVITAMPTISHAMPMSGMSDTHMSKMTDHQTKKMSDCHDHAKKTETKKAEKSSCCGDGCNCPMAACSSVVKIFGTNEFVVVPHVFSEISFISFEEDISSDFRYRIKRPPRV